MFQGKLGHRLGHPFHAKCGLASLASCRSEMKEDLRRIGAPGKIRSRLRDHGGCVRNDLIRFVVQTFKDNVPPL